MEEREDAEDQVDELEIDAVDIEDVRNSDELQNLLGLQADNLAAREAVGRGEDEWEEVDEEEELDDTFDSRQRPELPPGLAEPYRAHSKAVLSLSVDPSNSGRFCSGSQDDTVALWSLGTSAPLCRTRFSETVSLVRHSFNGELLFTATLDGSIHVLDCRADGLPTKHSLADFDGEVTVG